MKEFESGRSMVEMLGTLVIIGVLSIGGIAGYSYGMDKYRANTIMNDINLRAVDLIAQVGRGGDLSLSEWPTKTAGEHDIGLEMESGEATGGIFIKGVKQSVCEMLSEALIQTATIKIGATEYTDSTNIACGTENDMVFYYDDILSANGNACQDMENGVCFDKKKENLIPCTTVDDCPNTKCYGCVNEMCMMKSDGDSCGLTTGSWGGYCYQGECIAEDKTRFCSTHSNCHDDEFCAKYDEVYGVDPTREGKCIRFSMHKETLTLNDGTNKTIYVSDYAIGDIWLVDLCNRIGKHMITYNDLYTEEDCPLPVPTSTPTAFREALINAGYESLIIDRSIWDSQVCQMHYEAGVFQVWRTDLVGTYYAPGEAMWAPICH